MSKQNAISKGSQQTLKS